MPVILHLVEPFKRAYPHVEGITDWRAQQSIRLLWDRAATLDARLHALEATVGDLVIALNRLETQLTRVDRKADEALAKAQGTGFSLFVDGGGGSGSGEPTIPDYSAIVVSVLGRYDTLIAAADEDAGKAQLTRAAAWEIFQVDPNVGLLTKTTGHNIAGLSTDLVVQLTNGDFVDIASVVDVGGGMLRVTASWSAHGGDGSLIPKWVEPTAALAAMAGPMALL